MTDRLTKIKWRQELNIFGNNIMMENNGPKKVWMIKIYQTYKYLNSFKLHFLSAKLPSLLKLFIAGEILTWGYTNFVRKYLAENDLAYVSNTISNNFIYKFFLKEQSLDYLLNISIYATLGKALYIQNKNLLFGIFFTGGLFSFLIFHLNDKTKIYFDEKINIEDFNLFNPSINIIPKLLISFFILRFFYFLLDDSPLNLGKKFKLDKKSIFLFIWMYFIGKTSQLLSHFWSETLK
jgi:hypothetical protein